MLHQIEKAALVLCFMAVSTLTWGQVTGAVQNPSPFIAGVPGAVYHVDKQNFTSTCDLISSLVFTDSNLIKPPITIYSDVTESFTCDPFNWPTSNAGTGTTVTLTLILSPQPKADTTTVPFHLKERDKLIGSGRGDPVLPPMGITVETYLGTTLQAVTGFPAGLSTVPSLGMLTPLSACGDIISP